MVTEEKKITNKLKLKLKEDSRHGIQSWYMYLVDETTGLALSVGYPYYYNKQKARHAFDRASRFLKLND